MKIENIPADIKCKSLKEAKDEISEILDKLEAKDLDLNSIEETYKRLIILNKHVENLFKLKSKKISDSKYKIMIKSKLKKNARKIDQYLLSYLKKTKKSLLVFPMKYGVISGGKKIRTTIILDSGKLFNISEKKLFSICAAVECIHSYSLIHDDLPCMDDDAIRRGKLSTHKKFGEATAVLAGKFAAYPSF